MYIPLIDALYITISKHCILMNAVSLSRACYVAKVFAIFAYRW